MKKGIAKKWIKALRSGKYTQAHGMLRDTHGHCCLGVLSAISPWKNNYTKMGEPGLVRNLKLPEQIKKWAGMKTNTGLIKGEGEEPNTELTAFNDTYEKPFSFIADYIEDNWEKL